MDEPHPIHHVDPALWPTSPGRTFVPAAVEALARARTLKAPRDAGGGPHEDEGSSQAGHGEGSDATEDPAKRAPDRADAGDEKRTGRGCHLGGAAVPDLDRAIAELADLLRNRSLDCFARPVGGRGSVRLEACHWDHDDQVAAVTSGSMEVDRGGGETGRCWLFVDDDQLRRLIDVVEIVERPLSSWIGDAYQLHDRMERLADLAAANIAPHTRATPSDARPSAVPALAVGTTPEAQPEPVLAALISEARLKPTPGMRDRIEEWMADWLRKRFQEDKRADRQGNKTDYELVMAATFGDAAAGRAFIRVWNEATKGSQLDRRKPGPKPGRRDAAS